MATESVHKVQLAQSRFRALIADDEPSARQAINRVLEGDDSIDVVSQCSNGKEAIAAIAEHEPDMLFVDVQLPEIPGFQVVESSQRIPAIVFLSSLDRYATRAFEAHAADYVLKPFREERLLEAIERAKMRVQIARGGVLGSAAPQNSGASDAASSSQAKYPERLPLREHGRIFFQKVSDINRFTSAANYVVVHCGARTHRMRSTMNELEAKLDPKQFARIHRCTIINIEYMRDFRPLPHGDYLIRLHDGKELKMSRNYRLQFRNAIAALADKQ